MVCALGIGVASSASGATPQTLDRAVSVTDIAESVRVLPPRRATIIGDSAMAGVRWNGALAGLRGFNADPRLESCRRLVDKSCFGRERRRPDTALVEIGMLPTPLATDVLIIAVGYNDVDVRFAEQSREVLDAAVGKGYETIAWVTYREDVTYRLPRDTDRAISNYRNMNVELRELVDSGDYPALTLWDLNEYTLDASSMFTTDGVHQRRHGSWLVADWISRHMAALDGRPCPVRWTPTMPPDTVCPDPNTVLEQRGYPPVDLLYGF